MTAVTVYLIDGSCSCRACGLDWKAVQLETCPRCVRDEAIRRIKELEAGIESMYVEHSDRERERDEARTIARQLVALVRKLRGDLDGTKGQLRVLGLIGVDIGSPTRI